MTKKGFLTGMIRYTAPFDFHNGGAGHTQDHSGAVTKKVKDRTKIKAARKQRRKKW